MAAAPPSIFVLCPDDPHPCGGVRTLYRHADLLVRHGYRATVVHQARGFRCKWFAYRTPVAAAADVRPADGDVFVVPESFGPGLARLGRGRRTVVFSQNGHLTFLGYPIGGGGAAAAYLDPAVVGVLAVSAHVERYVRHAFPSVPTYRVRNSVDPSLFRYRPPGAKRPRVALMPRKARADAGEVVNLLRHRGALDGFEVVVIDGVTEAAAAAALGDAAVFLSFSVREGLGLPPLEAMACGCVTVGYDGFGGAEYLTADVSVPVPNGDTLAFAAAAERVLLRLRADRHAYAALTARAAALVAREYSPEREAASVVDAWARLLGTEAAPPRAIPRPQRPG